MAKAKRMYGCTECGPHCPAHLGKVAPHSVQPYMRLALALSLIHI